MTNPLPPVPPTGTRSSGAALWYSMIARYEFQRHELMLLREAVRSVDELDRLSEVIVRSRTLTPGGDIHPAIAEARQLRIALTSILAALHLPDGYENTPAPHGHPQRAGLSSVSSLVQPTGRHRREA